ncbi:lmo0937 family membrane protein [uncultured Mucilaginibacter sp.]|uniref:lmo0937 family membrane protein n=1 Tax=uncultured Mucilaginibacter sp. TaxID=797541 RepID=UPI0025DED3E8|nr:lmo0937 family membrane protein [uncultured Mucilaginibacter sp.]
MNSILYLVAFILVILWAIGFLFMAIGGLIHILLIIALISIVLGLIRRPTAT